uniref:ABC3 transporter permease C-terminal domain-containing protein n=1 Tax=uncultured bacterium contig00036 TaxID=1181524 RepID=A0A806KJ18_9BACT|nr:protein of unknown function DUF214 [uncultured bacterium contig00036]
MEKINLNICVLSLKNLRANPVRASCLMVVTAVLAFALFGGSIIELNLRQGLASMTNRFGADLMVIPKGAAEKAQTLLLYGGRNFFYFDAGILDTVAKTWGVAHASPQFFLASISSGCCDDAVQLIAYDPATDFVVQPWVAEKHSGLIIDGQVVVGSRIIRRPDGVIRLFNHEYPVAARLSGSASGFDTSIFMTMNTMRQLIDRAHEENYRFPADEYGGEIISVVLVKTDTKDIKTFVADSIKSENENVDVLVTQVIFDRITGTLSGFVKYIRIFSIAVWALAVVLLAAVFCGIIHERKKEFAILRILGATRKRLAGIVLSEAAFAGIAGGAGGIIAASLVVFPFSIIISEWLELPYLDAPFHHIMLLVLGSLFLSSLTGPLASLYAALRISKAETYYTMREGE